MIKMPPKQSKSSKGIAMHYSVGAIIERSGKYLLIDRVKPPYGFAGPAGHIDEGENELEALTREVKEETNLDITNHKLLLEEEVDWNTCSKGITVHYWYLYKCEVSGEVKRSIKEAKSIGWFSVEELKELELEPVWRYWFEKLNIIQS